MLSLAKQQDAFESKIPVHQSMSQGYDSWKAGREREKQRLTGEFDATEKAPAQPEPEIISDAPAPKEKISEKPPPKIVNPALTGRIRPEWKGNGK